MHLLEPQTLDEAGCGMNPNAGETTPADEKQSRKRQSRRSAPALPRLSNRLNPLSLIHEQLKPVFQKSLVIKGLLLFTLCFNDKAAAAVTNHPTNFRTNFVKDAVLSTDELNSVISLAESCGIGEVAEVKTFYYLPTTHRGILVTSKEKVDGRKITFQTLEINREEWSWKPKPVASGKTKSNGKFWIEGLGLPEINELTTFMTPKGIIRVSVAPEIEIGVADQIVKALTTSQIVYAAKNIWLSDPKHTDFSQPTWLGPSFTEGLRNADHYWVSFSKNLNRYEFILEGDKVKLVNVIHVEI